MPKNPFSPSNSAVNKPNRNAFDLSFSNNVTFNEGELIPVMCKETLPGDTFEIDSALALRFLPLSFPIQTKMRAHVHFFYQRARNLWEDFDDFIYGNDKLMNKTLVPPYLGVGVGGYGSNYNFRTGSLGDYLGLPTVRYNYTPVDNASGRLVVPTSGGRKVFNFPTGGNVPVFINEDFDPSTVTMPSSDEGLQQLSSTIQSRYRQFLPFVFTLRTGSSYRISILNSSPRFLGFSESAARIDVYAVSSGKYVGSAVPSFGNCTNFEDDPVYSIDFDFDLAKLTRGQSDLPITADFYFVLSSAFSIQSLTPDLVNYISYKVYEYSANALDAVDQGNNPLLDIDRYRISALPFRCYESIFNSFYRDSRNNPYLDTDNLPIYNRYLRSVEGGSDGQNYFIRHRNWEYDQFTSAVSSPQQGIAPLVGITSTGEVTFSAPDTGREYTFSTETADDADTITRVNVTEDIPNSVARSIVNVVTSGISINDFRNVNSYQRWLETNIRRGLKLKDQSLARWGVQPADSLLNMPEFIGGFSVDVDVNQVTNVSASGDAALGDFAGNAFVMGGSRHKIRQYCDQHGFIMAIVSVVPVPVYSQLLPKMFTRDNALDYYNPEFKNLGLQPVLYKELCPLLLKKPGSSGSGKSDTDVFGYQRPWYDYVSSNDEAHGLFRTDFNQFLMSRVFAEPPTLNPEFLTVNSSSLNDVYSVKQRHHILGQIRFSITAKRPIPSVSVPSL